MSRPVSDLILLSEFVKDQSDPIAADNLYRVISAASLHNMQFKEESQLNYAQKKLVSFRRQMFAGKIEKTKLLFEINQLEMQKKASSDLVMGDIMVVKGNLLQQMGNYEDAADMLLSAAKIFFTMNDEFRGLRAIINGKIFTTISASSYQSGELRALLQQTHRLGFYDLCGNLYRGLALELFIQGRYAEARMAIHDAIKNYRLLSFPDDEAIAYLLSALIWIHLDNPNKAQSDFSRVSIQSGKVEPYFLAAKACLAGLQPSVSSTHPLGRASWGRIPFRKQTLPFRIINLLKQGPLSRDEIIYKIWGQEALSESYCNRLYVIMNQIRSKQWAQIIFNGDRYELKA